MSYHSTPQIPSLQPTNTPTDLKTSTKSLCQPQMTSTMQWIRITIIRPRHQVLAVVLITKWQLASNLGRKRPISSMVVDITRKLYHLQISNNNTCQSRAKVKPLGCKEGTGGNSRWLRGSSSSSRRCRRRVGSQVGLPWHRRQLRCRLINMHLKLEQIYMAMTQLKSLQWRENRNRDLEKPSKGVLIGLRMIMT